MRYLVNKIKRADNLSHSTENTKQLENRTRLIDFCTLRTRFTIKVFVINSKHCCCVICDKQCTPAPSMKL